MITCREVTRLVSMSMDASLPVATRIRMRLHILLCRGCARFERQLRLVRDLLRRPETVQMLSEGPAGGTLSEEARRRIGEALRDA